MKRFVLILGLIFFSCIMLLASSTVFAQRKSKNAVSWKPLPKVECNYKTYEILPDDLSGVYTWKEAKKACDKLEAFEKKDWFLPDDRILMSMYEHKYEIGGFKGERGDDSYTKYYYWSSTKYMVDLNDGKGTRHYWGGDSKYICLPVRCVREYKK